MLLVARCRPDLTRLPGQPRGLVHSTGRFLELREGGQRERGVGMPGSQRPEPEIEHSGPHGPGFRLTTGRAQDVGKSRKTASDVRVLRAQVRLPDGDGATLQPLGLFEIADGQLQQAQIVRRRGDVQMRRAEPRVHRGMGTAVGLARAVVVTQHLQRQPEVVVLPRNLEMVGRQHGLAPLDGPQRHGLCGNRVAQQSENLREVSPVARDHDVVGAKRGLGHLHCDSILIARRRNASVEPLLRARQASVRRPDQHAAPPGARDGWPVRARCRSVIRGTSAAS